MKKLGIIGALLLVTSCSAINNVTFVSEPYLKPFSVFNFELGLPFVVIVNEHIYTVPKGFLTDLASVPRAIWSLYPPNDTRTIRAAIIHDYLYCGIENISRQEADSILYDALIADGLSRYTAYKYWLAVRLFGKSHFSEYKSKD